MSLRKLVAIAVLLTVVFSCKKKTVETDNLFKFKEYINYTTSGRVSVASPIEINLVKDVGSWEVEKEIDGEILTISPAVSGTYFSKNAHHLTFVPDEPLKADTEYSVKLNLGKLYPNIPAGFSDYTFQFKTITPNFSVSTTDLQSYSKDWQYLEGVINMADVAYLTDVKEIIEAKQNNKSLKIKWDEDLLTAKSFLFKVDSIQRFTEDSEILVRWDGRSVKSKNKGESGLYIP